MVRESKSAIRGRVLLPDDTVRRHGLVLSTKKRAELALTREARRNHMYAEIERLYSMGERRAEELLARAKTVKERAKESADPLGITSKKPRRKRRAGMDGRFEEGERQVVDPHTLGRPEAKKINVRESAIEHMASRGRLSDIEFAAADRFRKMWELVGIGRQRGIDMTSAGGAAGGGAGDPLTDALLRAGQELARVLDQLDPVKAKILISVVGEGKLIEAVARQWSSETGRLRGQSANGYISGTLYDAIDDLVRMWRMVAEGAPVPQTGTYKRAGVDVLVNDLIRASGPMSYTGPANEISVGKFGDPIVTKKRGVDRSQLTAHVSGNMGTRARKK